MNNMWDLAKIEVLLKLVLSLAVFAVIFFYETLLPIDYFILSVLGSYLVISMLVLWRQLLVRDSLTSA